MDSLVAETKQSMLKSIYREMEKNQPHETSTISNKSLTMVNVLVVCFPRLLSSFPVGQYCDWKRIKGQNICRPCFSCQILFVIIATPIDPENNCVGLNRSTSIQTITQRCLNFILFKLISMIQFSFLSKYKQEK